MANNVRVFWTKIPSDSGGRPADPLGLDAMREELADSLVPCLTGRTRSREQFYWALVIIGWIQEKTTEEERIQGFLWWERCLKLYWADLKEKKGFEGVDQARIQASEGGAPRTTFKPLLSNQAVQGMLGAHRRPLQKLGLVEDARLALTGEGEKLFDRFPQRPLLVNGDWESWRIEFRKAGAAFNQNFEAALRDQLRRSMPDLHRALGKLNWPVDRAWGKASKYIGRQKRPYALLANEFCDWADELRILFHNLVINPSVARESPLLPPRLSSSIPRNLTRWNVLRPILKRWKTQRADRVLGELHESVFTERGYANELWLRYEDSQLSRFPMRASAYVAPEGSDCRWSNAVQLMRPGK